MSATAEFRRYVTEVEATIRRRLAALLAEASRPRPLVVEGADGDLR
jgi:hypothetical protein